MRKVLEIAAWDYKCSVQSKAFIITLVAMPVMIGGSIVAQIFLKDKMDTHDKRIAIVDRTGVLFDVLAAATTVRNETAIFKGEGSKRKQIQPRYMLEKIDPADIGDAPQSTLKLSDRVRAEELFAFVEIAADVLDAATSPDDGKTETPRPGTAVRIRYHSNSPTYNDFEHYAAAVLNRVIQENRFARAGLAGDAVREATKYEPVDNLGLVKLDKDGRITEAEKINELATMFMPLGLMMLMWMAVMVGASPLMQSVLEEKMGRISEVLLGSVPPFQLMLGKLIGTVGVSMTIVTVYFAGAYFSLWQAGYSEYFPTHVLVWFVVYQALAVIMYGSLFGAIGAAVTDGKEAQSAMMPVMIVKMLPLFVWINVVREPNSTLSLAMSLFPPATPMLMIIRQSVPPGIPAWQPALGIVLVLITTIVCVFAAGRIFRVGLLMQGKGADFRQMLRWVLQG